MASMVTPTPITKATAPRNITLRGVAGSAHQRRPRTRPGATPSTTHSLEGDRRGPDASVQVGFSPSALPVHFSYLSFGIGTESHPIGTDRIDLGVKGSSACPAFARQTWKTPPAAGHYCIQVQLEWPDDYNPANNLGQHNTDVKRLNSPRAVFEFPVVNGGQQGRTLTLTVDGYTILPPPRCPPTGRAVTNQQDRLAAHQIGAQRRPTGWDIAVEPQELHLAPGESGHVRVEVNAPDGFDGTQAFNINAVDGARLIGGVTLYAQS